MKKFLCFCLSIGLILSCAICFSACELFKKDNLAIIFCVDGEEYSNFKTNGGEKIELPDNPTKDGYSFDGWYTDENFKNELDVDSWVDKELNDNVKVYAKFTVNQYTITYHLDNGINGNNPESYTILTSNITLQDANKEGHAFGGWYEEQEYINKIETIDTTTIQNYDLYAKFTINQYTITFDTNGGSEVDSITQDYNSVVTKPTDPIKPASIFSGWYTDNNTFENEYFFTTMPSNSITLYAKFDLISTPGLYKNGECIKTWDELKAEYPNAFETEGIISASSFSSYLTSLSGDLVIDEEITTIDDVAFHNCLGLTSITIPNGITSIGGAAFKGCSNLSIINIPNSLVSIGRDAFENCDSLVSVYFNGQIEDWCKVSFSSEYFVSNVKPMSCFQNFYYKNGKEWKELTKESELVIPDNVTSLGDYIFSGCSNITNLTLGNSIKSIGFATFGDCFNITNVYYNGSIEKWCEVTMGDPGASYSTILEYAEHFYFKDGDNWEELKGELVISDSVTSIGEYVFRGCSAITSVRLGKNVTDIYWGAFENCINIESVVMPISLKNVETRSFDGCSSLTSVYYEGWPQDWYEIIFEDELDYTEIVIYFYREYNPGVNHDGNFWHYVDNLPVVWPKEN